MTTATVVSEPRVYGPGSDHSYYRDLACSAVPGLPEHGAALERQRRYAREIATEAKTGTREGKRAVRAAQVLARDFGAEDRGLSQVRAITTGSNSGGSFITPQHLQDEPQLYRTQIDSFWRQLTPIPDPGFGMEILVPAFTSGSDVGAQTEAAAASNSTPTGQYLTAPLVTKVGEVDLSYALFDRSMGQAVSADAVVHAQLLEDLHGSIDDYALTVALANAGVVTRATFSVPGLWSDMAKAGANMALEPGSARPATHLFAPPAYTEWMAAQVDDNGRPLTLPSLANAAAPILPGPDGRPPVGFTGERVLHTSLFHDGHLPAAGSNAQLLAARPEDAYIQVSEVIARAVPDTLAGQLSVIVQLYAYVGVVVRYGKSFQAITGAAYPTSPTWA